MKITGLKTFVIGSGWRNLILLRLETDEPALYGIGEATVQWVMKECSGIERLNIAE